MSMYTWSKAEDEPAFSGNVTTCLWVKGDDSVQRELLMIQERGGRVTSAESLQRLEQMKAVHEWNGESHRSISPLASWASLRDLG